MYKIIHKGMLHSPCRDDRAINAVGLVKLLNRPDIKDIIDKKIMYLKEFDEYELSLENL